MCKLRRFQGVLKKSIEVIFIAEKFLLPFLAERMERKNCMREKSEPRKAAGCIFTNTLIFLKSYAHIEERSY